MAASFTLHVVSNTPPTLHVPADFDREGNTTGGWTAVLATDNLPDEHDVDTAGCLVLRPGRGGRSTPEARSAGRRLSGLLDQLHEPRRVMRVPARVARIIELDRC